VLFGLLIQALNPFNIGVTKPIVPHITTYSSLARSGVPLIVGDGMGAQVLRAGESVDFCALIRDDYPEYQIELDFLVLSPLNRLRLSIPFRISRHLPEVRAGCSVVTPSIQTQGPHK